MDTNTLTIELIRTPDSVNAFNHMLREGTDREVDMDWFYDGKPTTKMMELMHWYYQWDWQHARWMWGVEDGIVMGKTKYHCYMFTANVTTAAGFHSMEFALFAYPKQSHMGSTIREVRSIRSGPPHFREMLMHLAALRRSFEAKVSSIKNRRKH